ncbi:DgyrCDS9594 [Dimorphilus gyrociliatus]|uniref:Glycoprotein-N-acetylgalactosamine 3-beta-galactosyltransferase 1 n=1 Tax=Dimorphilus gyrociliatus TaxID=2664684 RepID=A0A7I8VXT9_9ANNE|nr:DgyrCDS9594 [Dimorphilus gyrociliatus]
MGPEEVQVWKDAKSHSQAEEELIQNFSQQVRILCWVLTEPKSHKRKAMHVKATWGKRCNKLLFMSSEQDPNLPSIDLGVAEGRNNLWGKTKAAFRYIYKTHLEDADFFLKADDDTYVIVENLRKMLMNKDSQSKIYFGRRFRPFVYQGYTSGGAGYVLTKEAVKAFVEDALPNPLLCRQDNGGPEDVEIGKCLSNVNVKLMDSRDEFGRERFNPFEPQLHLIKGAGNYFTINT